MAALPPLEQLRPAAMAVAYRMLGSVGEAEDVVQEALLRLHREQASGAGVAAPRAFLATVVTRLCIDQLRAARSKRERYVGEWLPEPYLTGPDADPAAHAELSESLSVAFLVLLERLSPEQRAAFLLREVFDYPYDDVARIVGTSEANARQLVARARRHVAARRPRFEASPQRREELARRFLAAAEEGDLASLEALLSRDVALHGDGGGRVPSLARTVYGRSRVARTLLAWRRAAQRAGGFALRPVEVNGQPGALMLDGAGRLVAVWALEIAGGQVAAVSSVVNPDKLRHLAPIASPP